jgi:hypothetical protein
MTRTSIAVGGLLAALGIGFYGGIGLLQSKVPSITALIPAFIGTPILLLGLVALKKDSFRMHAMHVVSLLAFLGFGLPVGRLGMQIAKGAELKITTVLSLVLTALLCGGLFGVCLKSFIDARRSRQGPADE